jgi:hypothetical protein
LKAII